MQESWNSHALAFAVYRNKLEKWIITGKSLKSMPKLDEKLISALDDCLKHHLTELMSVC